MALIPLCGKRGQGKFAIVDDEDYERVSKYRWYYDIRVKKRKDGSMPEYCHFRIRGNIGEKSLVSLHRFVLGVTVDLDVDHVNENPLDNRKENLKLLDRVTHAKKSAAKRKKNLEERKQCTNLQASSQQQMEDCQQTKFTLENLSVHEKGCEFLS